ncbi:MAG TPA: MetQ/NlpA family ABC transporter substrate-binding protein [Gammaproteobacteria bacterium]|nr:MetQ/NlpA family ABC transporter substrate-binding protein [Gammaproteobacteria bacterium]
MSLLKKLFKIILLATTFVVVSACSQKSSADGNTIKVGTIAGPETQLMEVAKQVAAKDYNLDIEIVPFTDYNMPNEALADGSIDANMFQHKPYLDAAIKAKGYKIVPVGKTFVYPMGVYSKKIHEISALPDGATVAIPNDPSNEARALLILQKANLITLKNSDNPNATVADIASNPKKLKFREIDAAQLPRVLPDVALAVINTNYAMIAGLLPSRDALIVESADSPYANLIVVRQGSENDPRVQHLVDALHSDAVKKEAKALFKDQAVPAW